MVLGELGNFIGKLGSEATRNLARNLFPGFYERGISANEALLQLREQGLGYRRTDFLKDYSAGKGEYDQSTRVRFVNEDNTPTQGILEPQYHGVPDKYSFVFRANGYDEEGNSTESYFFYHRNDILTRREMEQEAEDYITSTSGNSQEYIVTSVSLVEGYVNPIWA